MIQRQFNCKQQRRRRLGLALLSLYAVLILRGAALAVAEPAPDIYQQLAQASLEELLHTTVTTVARSPEDLERASAAVFVLTADDIRRSGATNIPEALRLVPGVNVASRDATKWNVSIRGFNARTADKILVLIDGRSIYDPLFSGTLWETKDIVLEDVERIEVIRGPGGSTWGANAVNGVINIITKSSQDTQGTLISLGGGSELHDFGLMRYGGKISNDTTYRIYAKGYQRDNQYLSSPGVDDNSENLQGGFRLDSSLTKDTSYSLSGNLYGGNHEGVTVLDDVRGRGGYLQGRWQSRLSGKSRLSGQAYFDRTLLEASILNEQRSTSEVDLQHEYTFDSADQLISSFQYRHSRDVITDPSVAHVDPERRSSSLVSAGVQARLQLVPDRWLLRLGGKAEYNDYTHFEFEPEIGLTFSLDRENSLWTKIARAVRTLSRLENDLFIALPGGPALISGSRALDSEKLTAYELGYRGLAARDLLVSIAGYYNAYDDLILLDGASFDNAAHGHTYGGEVSGTWSVQKNWRLSTGYSHINMKLSPDKDSAVAESTIHPLAGNTPQNQVFLRSSLDFAKAWELDAIVRYVDNLAFPSVSRYVVGDLRLAYHPSSHLELALVGQNLFSPHHFEEGGRNSSQVQEAVYGKVTWSF